MFIRVTLFVFIKLNRIGKKRFIIAILVSRWYEGWAIVNFFAFVSVIGSISWLVRYFFIVVVFVR